MPPMNCWSGLRVRRCSNATLVVDTTSSADVLALGVAAECEMPVAYVTGAQPPTFAQERTRPTTKTPRCWPTTRGATRIGSLGPLSQARSCPV